MIGSSVRFHLLTCRAHFGPPLPRVVQPHWLPGFCALGVERPLEYGERARIRARGVLEMSLTGNATRSTAVEMGPVSRL
jgi:hypothetical protein